MKPSKEWLKGLVKLADSIETYEDIIKIPKLVGYAQSAKMFLEDN